MMLAPMRGEELRAGSGRKTAVVSPTPQGASAVHPESYLSTLGGSSWKRLILPAVWVVAVGWQRAQEGRRMEEEGEAWE